MKKTEWILCLTVLLAVAGFSLPTPVMSPMFLDTDYLLLPTDTEHSERVAWLMLAFALYPLGQVIGGPWLGRWSDRWGRKPVLIASLVGVVLGYLVMAVSIWQQWLWLLLLSRFWEGLCNGNVAIAQAMAADISSPERKALLFSRLNVALNMGWIFGPLLGGGLAELGGNYAAPFIAAAGLAAVNLLAVKWGLPYNRVIKSPEQASTAEKPVSLWRLPRVRHFLLLTLVSYGAIMLYFNFFNIWLVEKFMQTPMGLAWAAVVISVPMMFGSWLSGRLAGKVHLLWLGVLGHVLMAVGMLLFIVPDQLVTLYLVMALAGVGITIAEQATSLGVSNHAPTERQGEAMGSYRALAMASELSGAALGALLVIWGTEWAYVGAALLAASCVLVFLKDALSTGNKGLQPA